LAPTQRCKQPSRANTSQQALALARRRHRPGRRGLRHALAFARSVVPAQVQVEVFAIDRQGGIVGQAGVQ
jgi:cobalt-precorrin-5B (C1)-methyltransferase